MKCKDRLLLWVILLLSLVPFAAIQAQTTTWEDEGQNATVSYTYSEGVDVVYDQTNQTYSIYTPKGLGWVAWVTNNAYTSSSTGITGNEHFPASAGFKDCTIELACDLDLADHIWIPIGLKKNFYGTFDGNDHVIQDYRFDIAKCEGSSGWHYVGLFGVIYNAIIQDVKTELSETIDLSTTYDNAALYVGAIVAAVKGNYNDSAIKSTIKNCHSKVNLSVNSDYAPIYFGGILGSAYSYGCDIINCSTTQLESDSKLLIKNSGNNNSSGIKAAGICGHGASVSFQNCIADIDIEVHDENTSANSRNYIGGIVAYSLGQIQHCTYMGEIEGISEQDSIYAGGIAGWYSGIESSGPSALSLCYTNAIINIESTNSSALVGGIVGYQSGSLVSIKDCYSLGQLSGKSENNSAYVGGISGYNDISATSSGGVDHCYSTAEIKAEGCKTYAGGITGYKNGGTIENCLALNEKGVNSNGDTEQYLGCIVGKNENEESGLSNNKASTLITLNRETPDENCEADKINGEPIYTSGVKEWVESSNGAFSYSEETGNLPVLNKIDINTGTYESWEGQQAPAVPDHVAYDLTITETEQTIDVAKTYGRITIGEGTSVTNPTFEGVTTGNTQFHTGVNGSSTLTVTGSSLGKLEK